MDDNFFTNTNNNNQLKKIYVDADRKLKVDPEVSEAMKTKRKNMTNNEK
jgi:hypothetical protein